MAKFEIPDAGTVRVEYIGPDPEGDCKVLWCYRVTDRKGRIMMQGRDLSTAPMTEGDPDRAAAAVIDFLIHDLSKRTGDLPDRYMAWNSWDFESSDNDQGYPDSINWFRVDGVTKWRREPYSESENSDEYWGRWSDAKQDMSRLFKSGELKEGTVWHLYPNDAEKPTKKMVLGRYGGVKVFDLAEANAG